MAISITVINFIHMVIFEIMHYVFPCHYLIIYELLIFSKLCEKSVVASR